MGRRQAGPGASTHPPASRLASSSSTSTPAIFQLPTDVWLYIFSNLPPEALAALSTACKRLLRLVDEHGWKALLALNMGLSRWIGWSRLIESIPSSVALAIRLSGRNTGSRAGTLRC